MAPYFEVDGRPDQSPPIMGKPLPEAVNERKLSVGEKVVLIKPRTIWSGDRGAEVLVTILSDKIAKVRVKTDDAGHVPGEYFDKDRPGALWFGGNYSPSESSNTLFALGSSKRIRRQKTFEVDSATIFTSGPKRIEWRRK